MALLTATRDTGFPVNGARNGLASRALALSVRSYDVVIMSAVCSTACVASSTSTSDGCRFSGTAASGGFCAGGALADRTISTGLQTNRIGYPSLNRPPPRSAPTPPTPQPGPQPPLRGVPKRPPRPP